MLALIQLNTTYVMKHRPIETSPSGFERSKVILKNVTNTIHRNRYRL